MRALPCACLQDDEVRKLEAEILKLKSLPPSFGPLDSVWLDRATTFLLAALPNAPSLQARGLS
jgi:hypothetical protein